MAFEDNKRNIFGLLPKISGRVVTNAFSVSRETFLGWKVFAICLKIFGGLSYKHSKGPQEATEEILRLGRKIFFILIGHGREILRIFLWNFSSGVVKSAIYGLKRTIWGGSFSRKEQVFSPFFDIDGKASGLLTTFLRGCQNCFLQVQRKNSRTTFLWNKWIFLSIADNENIFLASCQISLARVIMIALYLSRDTVWEKLKI